MINGSITAELASPEELSQITEWLCSEEIYQDAFMLAAAPDPAWIANSMLLIQDNLRVEFQPVRFWAVRDQGNRLLGFGVDYGWNRAHDCERELDFTLPTANRASPRTAILTLAAIIARIFNEHQGTAVWGRVRVGQSGKGFPRLFEAIGGQAMDMQWDLQPTTGRKLPRVYYRTNPESFFASRIGARYKPG